jgi:hypothetical protein
MSNENQTLYNHSTLKKKINQPTNVVENTKTLQYATSLSQTSYKSSKSINILKNKLYTYSLNVGNCHNIVYLSVILHLNGLLLKCLSNIYKNNFELVLKAVRENGLALQYASDNLKQNKKIASAAIAQNINSIEFIHYDLKENKEFIITLLKRHYHLIINYLSKEILFDSEIILYLDYDIINDSHLNMTIKLPLLHQISINKKTTIQTMKINKKKYRRLSQRIYTFLCWRKQNSSSINDNKTEMFSLSGSSFNISEVENILENNISNTEKPKLKQKL